MWRTVDKHPDEPAIKQFLANEAERDRLREQLNLAGERTFTQGLPEPDYGELTEPVAGRRVAVADRERRRKRTEIVGGPELEDLKAKLGELIYTTHQGPPLRKGQRPLSRSGSKPVRTPGSSSRTVRFAF